MKKLLQAVSTGVLFSLAFAAVAFASSYNSYFSLNSNLTGQVRTFDGTNIKFGANATSTPYKHTIQKNYTATLKRSNRFIDDTIGSVTMNRDEYSEAKWTNVGTGNYYIYLTKPIDGITLVAGSQSNQTVVFANY